MIYYYWSHTDNLSIGDVMYRGYIIRFYDTQPNALFFFPLDRTNNVLSISPVSPLGQVSDGKNSAENWPSPLQPTLLTGIPRQKPKWRKSAAWLSSSTRSSSRTSDRRPVRETTHAAARHFQQTGHFSMPWKVSKQILWYTEGNCCVL